MAQSRVNVTKIVWVKKRLAKSPHTYIHPWIKVKGEPYETPIPHAIVALKQIKEKCGWGPNCPICKKYRKGLGWSFTRSKCSVPQQNILYTQTQGTQQPSQKKFQCPQPQNLQQPQNFQCSQSQSFDIPNLYTEQICQRKEWEEKMERLHDKYGLDYYSSSESELDWEEEPKYETLIWKFVKFWLTQKF